MEELDFRQNKSRPQFDLSYVPTILDINFLGFQLELIADWVYHRTGQPCIFDSQTMYVNGHIHYCIKAHHKLCLLRDLRWALATCSSVRLSTLNCLALGHLVLCPFDSSWPKLSKNLDPVRKGMFTCQLAYSILELTLTLKSTSVYGPSFEFTYRLLEEKLSIGSF